MAARVRVVADVGSNWRAAPGESVERGRERWRRLIAACADAGADLVKGQYLRRTAYPEGSDEAHLVSDYEWPAVWLPWLREECHKRGVEFLCTVFEPEHVSVLEPYVPAWKIASFEALRGDLLRACRATGKPLVVSTGTLSETEVGSLLAGWGAHDTLLHCVSKYPAAPADYDLAVLRDWANTEWHDPPGAPGARGAGRGRVLRVGLSDHTAPEYGSVVAVMAVALGAWLVETHVTLDRNQQSPDAHFSRTPKDLDRYVRDVRLAAAAVGDGIQRPREGEAVHYRYDPKTGKRGTSGGR